MLTAEAMGKLAAEMADAQTHGDAESLAAIAWQSYGEVGEDLAEIGGCGPPSTPRGASPQ